MYKKIAIKKISGFTIIEAIVALVLISLTVSLSFGVVFRIRDKFDSTLYMKAILRADLIYNQTVRDQDFSDFEIRENLIFKRTAEFYGDYNKLYKVTISAYNTVDTSLMFERLDLIMLALDFVMLYIVL